MVFKRFRRNAEANPSHDTYGQLNAEDPQAYTQADFQERARVARETQEQLARAAIRLAQQRREELFGWKSAPEAPFAQPSDPVDSEDSASEPQQNVTNEEAERQRQEAERQRQEAEQRQQEAARQEAEQRRQEAERQRQEAERQEAARKRAEQHQREQEAERRRQEATQDPAASARLESLLLDLIKFNPELKMFDNNHVKSVIGRILSGRSAGTADWHIHLGFHPDKQPGTPSANQDFQVSTVLIKNKGKNAYYSFS